MGFWNDAGNSEPKRNFRFQVWQHGFKLGNVIFKLGNSEKANHFFNFSF